MTDGQKDSPNFGDPRPITPVWWWYPPRNSNKHTRLGLELKNDLSSIFQRHFTLRSSSASSPSLWNSHYLATWDCPWSVSAAPPDTIAQSFRASSHIVGSVTSLSMSVFPFFLFKTGLYCWGKTIFLSFSIKWTAIMEKEASHAMAPVTVYMRPKKRLLPPLHLRVQRTTDFSPWNLVTGKSKRRIPVKDLSSHFSALPLCEYILNTLGWTL